MATTTVTLQPRDIAASVQSLKAEFARANLSDLKTTSRNGALLVEMPIARLSDYRFEYADEHCSWRTPKQKVVIDAKGFLIEQRTNHKAFHLLFKSGPATAGNIQKVFYQRSMRAIEGLQSLGEKRLAEAVQAPTDYSVLLSALNTEEALASIRVHDPLAAARLRGLEAKRNLVEAEGGTLTSAEVARKLRITRQAVDKRRKEGRLLALELGRKGFRFPAWQLDLPQADAVLRALEGRDPWEQLTFFLNPSELLGDRSPLQTLRDKRPAMEGVLRAAAAFAEHGA
jgi:hypothetical protein